MLSVALPSSALAKTKRCDGLKVTIGADKDGGRLTGTGDDDVILGSKAADRIDGRGGDDRICPDGVPAEGVDVVKGGSGPT